MTTRLACLLGAPVDLGEGATGRIVDVLADSDGVPLSLCVSTPGSTRTVLVPMSAARESAAGGIVIVRGPFLDTDEVGEMLSEHPHTTWVAGVARAAVSKRRIGGIARG